LQADGWVLRSDIPWVCRNKMPESVNNRPSKALEYVFMLVKRSGYYFDMDAIKKQGTTKWTSASFLPDSNKDRAAKCETAANSASRANRSHAIQPEERNFRNGDLWFASIEAPHGMVGVGDELVGLDVTTVGLKEAHFAAFAPKLILPLILAGTSQKGCCSKCGAPWKRVVNKERIATRPGENTKVTGRNTLAIGNRDPQRHVTSTKTVGWEPFCKCENNVPVPCVVFDPFCGSGTTGIVSIKRGRRFIGCELNPDYLMMAAKRLAAAEVKRGFGL
jgi:DNA modification methylase